MAHAAKRRAVSDEAVDEVERPSAGVARLRTRHAQFAAQWTAAAVSRKHRRHRLDLEALGPQASTSACSSS